jgi:hypothetical protein
MKTLKEIAEHALKTAKQLIVAEGRLMPVFVLYNASGEQYVVGAPWNDDADKQIMVSALRGFMAKMQITQYVHVSEAWGASVDKTTGPELAKLRPSERNDRQEVIVVTASDNHDTVALAEEIIRDAAGQVSDTKPIWPKLGAITGRMTDILKRPAGPLDFIAASLFLKQQEVPTRH